MAYMKQGQYLDAGIPSEQEPLDVFNAFSSLEKGRFHLYVSYGCPFAHRALLTVSLLGLQGFVSVSSVAPLKEFSGWEFSEDHPDPLASRHSLSEVYRDAKQDYSGRVSVPVLWDKKHNTIVSNDSLAITKWLAKQQVSRSTLDLIPASQEQEIEAQCQWINSHINSLPFKAGFTNDQKEYEQASSAFFNNLAILDEKLSQHTYFNGDAISLSDVLIIPTLIQMELVYTTHFKLNYYPLRHFKHISKYLTGLMRYQAISDTFNLSFIKTTYFVGQPHINPSKIIPVGPHADWLTAIQTKRPLSMINAGIE